MKYIIFLMVLTINLSAVELTVVSNNLTITYDSSSYGTQPYHLWADYHSTYFYNGYPDKTFHCYDIGESGISWQGQYEVNEEKLGLPIWALGSNQVMHLLFAQSNGGYNQTNQIYPWGTNQMNGPLLGLYWNGTASTNEGVIIPNFTPYFPGAIVDQTNGNAGSFQLNLASAMLSTLYNVSFANMCTNTWVVSWSNACNTGNQFTNVGYYSGGHPYAPGQLDIAIQDLKSKAYVETNVASSMVDYANGGIVSSSHIVISSISRSASSISFVANWDRLPMSWDVAGTVLPDGSVTTNDATGAFRVNPANGMAFRFMFGITNMPLGTYNIYVDNVLTDIATSAQLTSGRNWFTNYSGPLWTKRAATLYWKRAQDGCNATNLLDFGVNSGELIPGTPRLVEYVSNAANQYDTLHNRGTNHINAMRPFVRSGMYLYDDKITLTAQPVPHNVLVILSTVDFQPAPFR